MVSRIIVTERTLSFPSFAAEKHRGHRERPVCLVFLDFFPVNSETSVATYLMLLLPWPFDDASERRTVHAPKGEDTGRVARHARPQVGQDGHAALEPYAAG